MGHCSAPCTGKVTREDYAARIEDAKKLLSGRNDLLIRDMRLRMKKAAENQEYELAKTIRDQIAGMEFLQEKQNMETGRSYDQDIINYITYNGRVHLSVYRAERGILSGKDEYEFDCREGFLEEFMLQYYSDADIPREIIVPEEVSKALISYLSERKGTQARVVVPQKGEKKDLLDS